MPLLYYMRSRDGLEVDLVIEQSGKLYLFEIKSAMTITAKHAVSLKRIKDELGSMVETAAVLSCSEENYLIKDNIFKYGWKNVLGV